MHSTQQPRGGERCSGFQPCRKASLSMPQIDHPGCPAQGAMSQSLKWPVGRMKNSDCSIAVMEESRVLS